MTKEEFEFHTGQKVEERKKEFYNKYTVIRQGTIRYYDYEYTGYRESDYETIIKLEYK